MGKNTSTIAYLGIFKKAWKITWKNRYLWWYGFFMVLSGTGSFFQTSSEKNTNKNFPPFEEQFSHLSGFIYQNLSWIILIFLFILVFAFFLFFLKILSQGALIASIEKHSEEKFSNFKTAFQEGKKYWWKIFLASLFLCALLFFIVAILFFPIGFLFLSQNMILGIIMSILAGIILLPIFILTFFIKTYGYIYIVLGKINIWQSLENAYLLFRKNISSSLFFTLLLIFINFIFFIALIFSLIPIILLFLPFGLIFFLILGKIGAAGIAIIACFILGLLALLFFSVCTVFSQSAWVLFFKEIATPDILEEIEMEAEKEIPEISKTLPITEFEKK